MAESGLDSLTATHAVAVTWKAYELRPAEAPPRPPAEAARFRAYLREGWPRVQAIARERFGVTMQEPPYREGLDTRLAHIATKYAETLGRADAFHRAVFSAYWQSGADIGSPAVLTELAQAAGLEPAAFQAALQAPDHRAAVLADEAWAQRNQLGGVPAFIFGGRYLVSGAQPVAVLRQVAERCLAEGLTEDPAEPD